MTARSDFAIGDRVRFNDECPWPERVGCVGTVVAPPCDHYPQPSGREVLLCLDDDPLNATHADGDCVWTCVARKSSLSGLGGFSVSDRAR